MNLEFRQQLRRPGFELDVEAALAPGVTALLGPSGSGKTSLLRCLAGLEPRVSGRLRCAGQCWQDAGFWWPAHRRLLGYLGQTPALFPNLDVAGNLRFARRRAPVALSEGRAAQLYAALQLEPLLARPVAALSGGEARRVALGRALLRGATLLLLDEPCAGLDDASQRRFLSLLKSMVRRFELQVIYVAHNLAEAAMVADQACLLDAGRLRAQGAFDALATDLELPLAHATQPVGRLQGEVCGYREQDQLVELAVGDARLLVPDERRTLGSTATVVVPGAAVMLAHEPQAQGSVLNVLPVRVAGLAEAGPGRMLVRLRAQGGWLLAQITRYSAQRLGLVPGAALYAHIKAVAISEN